MSTATCHLRSARCRQHTRALPTTPGYPLLTSTDQEGGEVNRLPGGPTLSAKEVGESSDPASAGASSGTTIAQVFSENGVNTDLAPVLGVYRQAGDFLDQYQRSYGNTSSLVSECIGPLIANDQSGSVISTAKHFPGLGAATANEDTDDVPVTIYLTLDELRTIDEVPYKTAISNGVEAVMPSWAVYLALDSQNPSGMSSLWLRSELRERLGFQGVTISDSIGAGALEDFGNDGQRGVTAVIAGMDIILADSQNATQGPAVVDAIVAALQDGSIGQDDFNESTVRIQAQRQSLA